MRRQGAHYKVPFRRRRLGRTDYRRRLRLLQAHRPRAVVRKTLRNTIVQIVTYETTGDRIVASAVSKELGKLGWSGGTGNVPAAYLTGYLAGRRALRKGVAEAILDVGMQAPTRGGRVFASLRGLVDAGLQVPHSADVLPGDERVHGAHINPGLSAAFEAVLAKLGAA